MLRERSAVVFGLQNRSDQITQASNLKQQQMSTAVKILQSELRLHQNELHVVRMELKIRKIAAKKLEARAFIIQQRVGGIAAK